MKIACYTIAKNESQFVARWAESCADADVRLIVDTGSTDDTVAIAKELGLMVAEVSITPWRFDDARNIAVSLIPADVDLCIALDADEILMPGWREHLEHLPPEINRPRYMYTWSWNADGSPGLQYHGDKIHSRHGFRWKHPVHEVMVPVGEERHAFCGLEIHHHPDPTKSRGQYLPLLELAVREDPTDDRNCHYLGRELFFQGQTARAVYELKRHLSLPKARWAPERARSMQYLAQCLPAETETWLLRAAAEDPHRREIWIDLVGYYYRQALWGQCVGAAMRAFTYTERRGDYMTTPEAWGWEPYDQAAISAFRIGLLEQAVIWGNEAIRLNPDAEHLYVNQAWYEGRVEVEDAVV